jgi:hypothetical protein
MKKIFGMIFPWIGLLLMVVSCFVFASCSSRHDEIQISECEAIKIAKQHVPARIADSSVSSGFRLELGLHGAWFVIFPNISVTPEEIGWAENDITHFIQGENITQENDLPIGTYLNVVIYVDAETGDITGNELNNGLFTGPPAPECN